MGIEAEALRDELGFVKAHELDKLGACDEACGGERSRVVSTDRRVGDGAVSSEVEETVGSGGDGIVVLQVGGLHGDRLSK